MVTNTRPKHPITTMTIVMMTTTIQTLPICVPPFAYVVAVELFRE
ncbi:hypothetical protein [Parapedobacter indicus]|nr:hypothetical protein [Parapedobacter indicus]